MNTYYMVRGHDALQGVRHEVLWVRVRVFTAMSSTS